MSGLAGSEAVSSRRQGGYGSPLRAGEWHTFRVRPANHPRHRIAGAARLLARCLELGADQTCHREGRLPEALNGLVVAGNAARLTQFLTVKGNPAQATACVGAGRARDLAVNVVLPFCHGWSGSGNDTSAIALYRKFPRLQANEITREMADRLLPQHWAGVVNSARRQQGLIHLHRQLSG